MAIHHMWHVFTSVALFPCALFVVCHNIEGQRVVAVSIHLHHDHVKRKDEWTMTSRVLDMLQGEQNIVLMDHHSMALLPWDAYTLPTRETKDVLEAT